MCTHRSRGILYTENVPSPSRSPITLPRTRYSVAVGANHAIFTWLCPHSSTWLCPHKRSLRPRTHNIQSTSATPIPRYAPSPIRPSPPPPPPPSPQTGGARKGQKRSRSHPRIPEDYHSPGSDRPAACRSLSAPASIGLACALTHLTRSAPILRARH